MISCVLYKRDLLTILTWLNHIISGISPVLKFYRMYHNMFSNFFSLSEENSKFVGVG